MSRKPRPLGNPTTKAWLAGWDSAISGISIHANPYTRRPQADAWKRGWQAGLRSWDDDVRLMMERIGQ
jgi:ribosome modulation factor